MNLSSPIHNTTSPNNEDAMTAAMGFSAFGSTHPAAHPSKRKKYTHETRDHGRDTATGGNMLPLGIPRGARDTTSHDVHDQSEPNGRRNVEAEKQQQQRGGNLDGDGEGKRMQYNGSLKKKNEEEEEETAMLLKRQNALLQRINEGGIETRAEGTYAGHNHHNNNDNFNISEAAHHPEMDTTTPPRRHNTEDAARGSEEHGITGPRGGIEDGFEGHTWHEWRKGVRDSRGDMAFYDASFVEDSWRGFNKTRGGEGG